MRRLRFGGRAVSRALFENRPVNVPDVRPDAQLPPLACFGILAARSRRGGLFGQQRIRRRPKLRLGVGQLAIERRQPGILFGGSRLETPQAVELAAKGGLTFLNLDKRLLRFGHRPTMSQNRDIVKILTHCRKTSARPLQRRSAAIGHSGGGKGREGVRS